MQRNWLATVKAKEREAAAASQAPIPTQPAEVPATQFTTSLSPPKAQSCAVCTPLGKLYPNECPITTNWDEDLREEEEKRKRSG